MTDRDPVVFYTERTVEYECPNGHTHRRDTGADTKESIPWLRAFRGHCPGCDEEWPEFVESHTDDWAAILDENYPEDPSFFEWTAQRVTDWHRLTGPPRGRSTVYPHDDDFAALVAWTATESRFTVKRARTGRNDAAMNRAGDSSRSEDESHSRGRSDGVTVNADSRGDDE